MRKEIYEAVKKRLLTVMNANTGEAVLDSVDLWRGSVPKGDMLPDSGHTVAYVEFMPSEWVAAGTVVPSCELKFALHVTGHGVASLRLMEIAEELAHSLHGWLIPKVGRIRCKETAVVHTADGVCECLETLCCTVREV